MALSFPSRFAPTSSSQSSKNKVFLNFRGVDTRKNYVDNLYIAFKGKEIYPYKDDETIEQSEPIRQSLMKAIEESDIAVVVFSKNYAMSAWCLDELEHIMKCCETRGLKVYPVFHKVVPTTVRFQKGRYRLAFFMHRLTKNKKKVKSWRKALYKACEKSGWETKVLANGHEGKGIEVIVNTISAKLLSDTSSVNDVELHPDTSSAKNGHLIGIEARLQPLKLSLKLGLGGVHMIGIWGIGGGGKTTLATAVYSETYKLFDYCCFLANIREESSRENGLVRLQEKMLSGFLKQKQVRPRNIEEGRHMIMDELCNKRVLIVLDDVDRLDQLEALAGSRHWFGEGSRIVITTRDQHLLVAHRVNVIHDLYLLNDDEANKLFCKIAFRNSRPTEDHELLLQGLVSYAGGLPLAVKVLGSFLCDKDIHEWTSVLDRLKEYPDANILEKLKISFDGLEPVEKRLFLDIACFFRGEHTHEGVMTMLDGWGFDHVRGMKVLIRKGLISISDGKFVMHSLLQDMAHYINREEQHNNPHKHSTIWRKEVELINMCATKDATKVGRRDKATCSLTKKFQPRELSDLTLSELVQKQLWEAYKADESDTLLPQTNEINYHKSVALGHGYDDSDGDRRQILVSKETPKNDRNRMEREVLKRLEKGKSKVDMEVVETLEDRIVNRMEGVFQERMDRLENKMVERLDMLENRMSEIVVKRMKMEAGGVVQRMERLTNLIVEMEGDHPDNKTNVEEGNPTQSQTGKSHVPSGLLGLDGQLTS